MQITAKRLDDTDALVQIDSIPDVCPLCHYKNIPKIIASVITSNGIRSIYQCANDGCREVFIAYYEKTYPANSYFSLGQLQPQRLELEKFNSSIEEISPSFIKIFNQALAAEACGLDQISGVGLRKSLEFLIKDYLISKKPESEDIIKSEFLGTCIKNRVEDTRIKVCAERAVWLGNDETHYYKRWEDKDIKDLKILIKLTAMWIESSVMTNKYLEDMNPETN